MEIEINKEIRNYNESIFFGLTFKAMYFLRYGADFFSIDLFYIIPVPTHCHLVAYLHSGSNSDCRH